MKISYNWLKNYVPNLPEADKMWDIFTYHLCEVEEVVNLENGDTIFDINILPNRAHDLLSHIGVARELAYLLGLEYKDPIDLYKIPNSEKTNLSIKIDTDKCRRYMGRIIRNVEVKDSTEWVRNYLESIGQRSINNVVDATNIVMYDSGQPTHCFDLDKITGGIVVRFAKDGESMTTLDNKEVKLDSSNMVIADEGGNILALAGVKGGKHAEVDKNTKNILVEVANFDPVSVRKTRRMVNIFTDSAKRFENDLSPELCDFAMRELSGLFVEYGFTHFEEIVDVYKVKQEEKSLAFSLSKISKILGKNIEEIELVEILQKYHFDFKQNGDIFEIKVPAHRLDLNIEEDMTEEVGRIIGYKNVIPKLPKTSFVPKFNEIYKQILFARKKMLEDGYSEVMTYTFCDKGEVEVLASASDKKFLRTNLSDGLKESIKMNILNAPLIESKEIKVFEIGSIFLKDKSTSAHGSGGTKEELRIAFGDKKKVEEISLEEFMKKFAEFDSYSKEFSFVDSASSSVFSQVLGSPIQNFKNELAQPDHSKKQDNLGQGNSLSGDKFKMWSLFPFITRDVALWVPENVSSEDVEGVIKENINELVVKGPTLFDEFKKDGRVSYAFRLVFQSYERTLTDEEVNQVFDKITQKLKENPNWEIR